jgi:hypothetical protein
MESNQSRSCFQVGGRCKCIETLVPLNKLRERNLLCDAVLRLDDGGFFRVHRVILSMRSEYFRFVHLLTWLINMWNNDIIDVNSYVKYFILFAAKTCNFIWLFVFCYLFFVLKSHGGEEEEEECLPDVAPYKLSGISDVLTAFFPW